VDVGIPPVLETDDIDCVGVFWPGDSDDSEERPVCRCVDASTRVRSGVPVRRRTAMSHPPDSQPAGRREEPSVYVGIRMVLESLERVE
jgi:hypothetical protein